MIYQVTHRTTFTYSQPVAISHHVLRLTPRSHPRQHCLRSNVIFNPTPSVRSEGEDYFGNPITHLTIQTPHPQLIVEAKTLVDITKPDPLQMDQSPPWDQLVQQLQTRTDSPNLEAHQFMYDSPYITIDDATYDFVRECFPPGRPLLAGVMDLTSLIFREFTYEGGVTEVSTPVKDVLASRKGVCQDFAHLEIAALRSLGLPARYISGYLLTHPPEGKEKLVGADASHAWISTWSPDLGWVDFDPTNNLTPGDEHITLAWGRDYGDVSPINGFMVGGGQHTLDVSVDVSPIPHPSLV
ncbi:MAG: transglutaminase [Nitrospira bacterium SG8_3]|nr:MAG: transglutaminase [Nitrospira bacterium SG8_3]MDH4194411.1 transglutaminase family protein [Nitrospirota bacterium]MDH5575357.1 transglutaminase family protein [Nitrospirota bacterium]